MNIIIYEFGMLTLNLQWLTCGADVANVVNVSMPSVPDSVGQGIMSAS